MTSLALAAHPAQAGTMMLVFVYNANAGLLAGALDTIHKTLSPETYPCSLCAITYGAFAMDRRWRAYLQALPVEAKFYHRPDFWAAYPGHADTPLPLIAMERDGELQLIMTAGELRAHGSLDALMAALDARLRGRGVASAGLPLSPTP